jgi:hypothetical protein
MSLICMQGWSATTYEMIMYMLTYLFEVLVAKLGDYLSFFLLLTHLEPAF